MSAGAPPAATVIGGVCRRIADVGAATQRDYDQAIAVEAVGAERSDLLGGSVIQPTPTSRVERLAVVLRPDRRRAPPARRSASQGRRRRPPR